MVEHLSDIKTLVNCSFNTSERIIDCLRTKNVSELLNTKTIFNYMSRMTQLTWTPTQEEDDDNNDAIITDDPKKLIHEMKDLPFIVGVNVNEGLLVTGSKYSK